MNDADFADYLNTLLGASLPNRAVYSSLCNLSVDKSLTKVQQNILQEQKDKYKLLAECDKWLR